MESEPREVFISVDIEASGPSPATGSMLAIGACLVEDPAIGLYIELEPLADRPWAEEAAAIHGLNRQTLERDGLTPRAAMERFATWLDEKTGPSGRPVFVGFNAPFDWMFVTDYFWRYLGRNPFGVSALDLKSYFMAQTGVTRWEETRRRYVDRRLRLNHQHNHHALDDARGQAAIARVLMGYEDAVEK